MDIAVEVITPDATKHLFPTPLPCEVSQPWPRRNFTDEGTKPLLVLAMVSNISETTMILQSLDKTTTKCHNEVKPGFYNPNNGVNMLPIMYKRKRHKRFLFERRTR